jgi:predicted transcriptional regulator
MNFSDLTIKTKAGKRPLTDLERCLLLILGKRSNISSRDVLKEAKKLKICASCSDRSEVFFVGEKLLRKKLVERILKNREYIWRLSQEGKRLLKID